MYSKIKIAGHPVHPMLVAFPVVCYTGTLVAFAVYGANGHLFWLNLGIALSVVGVGGAVLAAVPGLADWAFGIPRDSAAKLIGLVHAALNVAALGLFAAVLASYVSNWNGPAAGATLGIVLSAIGVAATGGRSGNRRRLASSGSAAELAPLVFGEPAPDSVPGRAEPGRASSRSGWPESSQEFSC